MYSAVGAIQCVQRPISVGVLLSMIGRFKGALIPFGSIFTGLAIWEFASRVIVDSKLFLAAPTQIVLAIYTLAQSGVLGHHIAVSAGEFALGFVIASIIGIVVGLSMALSKFFKAAAQPWISGLYATPTVALAPLFLLWFGIGMTSKVVVVILLVLFPVAINTEAGMLLTNPRFVETAKSFGASRMQTFFKVFLPSATPMIFTGLKLGVGRALIGVVVAELFGARAGLGRLIADSAETYNMPNLFAGVIILAVAGIIITSIFNMVERRLFAWVQD